MLLLVLNLTVQCINFYLLSNNTNVKKNNWITINNYKGILRHTVHARCDGEYRTMVYICHLDMFYLTSQQQFNSSYLLVH